MTDRFRVSSLWAQRLTEHRVSLPALLQRAGLPSGFFQQEKIYVTTSELFSLWRAIGETSGNPGIGLKLGSEPRLERYDATAIAAVCSQSFRDALQRLACYKQLTCPEEIRIHSTRDEASVEFFYLQAREVHPRGCGTRGTFFDTAEVYGPFLNEELVFWCGDKCAPQTRLSRRFDSWAANRPTRR